MNGVAGRARDELSADRSSLTRLGLCSERIRSVSPHARDAVHGSALLQQRLVHEAGRLAGIPGIIVQGRYDLLCPPAISHSLGEQWREAEIRFVESAGHALY